MELTKDTYLEIAKKSDDKTLLNMLSVNKNFNDEKTFKEMFARKFPFLVSHFNSESDKSWKQYLLKTLYYISKLKEELNYE